MTDVVETPAPQADETAARRGRPRPDNTVQRDEQVFEQLSEPRTRGQLAEMTGLDARAVYLSLHRLRTTNRIQRTREGAQHVWSRVATPAE